jgi:ActR/RegA family two-component response regulator
MPEINGWDLARAIKAQDPRSRMVLVTGWSSQIEPGSAQGRGVDFILPKPFALDDVERVLRDAVESIDARSAA